MNHPEIHVTPATPSTSTESFETASSNRHEWDLTPYQFNCPLLPAVDDSSKELNEIATVRLPEYHRLVDHTLGVAWRTICNGRRDIGKLSPDQIAWAIKVVEAHRNGHSQHSDDMRMLIQYWQEILVAMYVTIPTERTADQSQLLKETPLEDSSFVLTNMRPKGTTTPPTTLSPLTTSTPLPRTDERPSSLSRTQKVLNRNLESLHHMLVRWKKDQLRRIDIDMQQLEAIERLLVSMAAEDRTHSQQQTKSTADGTNFGNEIENEHEENKHTGCWP